MWGHEHECLADPWESAEAGGAFSVMRVSPEKFSQLAHVLFLKNLDGVKGDNDEKYAMLRMRYNLFRGGSDMARVS